jgi:ADP-ribose pyrophosphatase YjhB (NUDIX family)
MVQSSSERWVLPASHLLFGETPGDAADRVRREQIGGAKLRLEQPRVLSEVYSPPNRSEWKDHWDIGFVYRGTLTSVPAHPAVWTRLEFVDVGELRATEVARDHDHVLEFVGLPPQGGAPGASVKREKPRRPS